MFEPTKLSFARIRLCERTMSSNAFFLIVQDALLQQRAFSVVRMADGEWLLWQQSMKGDGKESPEGRSPRWLKNLGCEGISKEEILGRLASAARACTYFSPSISGVVNPEYDIYKLFQSREVYVDNFFVNQWQEWMIRQLYQLAGKVLIIHRNPEVADALQVRAWELLKVEVTWLKHESWRDSLEVLAQTMESDARLVIASVGPAGKCILPRIANGKYPKTVLDIGNTMDRFILYDTWKESEEKKLQEAAV
jgi:hypothetical protein